MPALSEIFLLNGMANTISTCPEAIVAEAWMYLSSLMIREKCISHLQFQTVAWFFVMSGDAACHVH